MLSGKIRNNSTSGTQLYISKGLDNPLDGIRTPIVYNEVEMASQYIQIGYERHKITVIDNDTDDNYTILTVDSAFSTLPVVGDTYKIISNYIISPFYYFKARTNPTLTATTSQAPDGTILCSANYAQAESVSIKKYKWQLYKSNGSGGYDLITESSYIFSERLDYKFSQYLEIAVYKAKCICVTQDDVEVTHETTFTTDASNTEIISSVDVEFNQIEKCIEITMNAVEGIDWVWYNVYRKEDGNPNVRMIGRCGGVTNVERKVKDYLIGTGKTYQYFVIPSNISNERCKEKSSVKITPEFDTWTLTSLSVDNNTLFEYDTYTTIETWNIEFNVSNNDIVNNLNRTSHIGSGRYGKVSMNDVNYITGGFSGLVSYIDCATNDFEDTIQKAEAWRKFITGKNPFLIKSPKGDCWFCHIVENPSTKYEDNTYLTTVSVSFIETENINNIIVNYEY